MRVMHWREKADVFCGVILLPSGYMHATELSAQFANLSSTGYMFCSTVLVKSNAFFFMDWLCPSNNLTPSSRGPTKNLI